MNIFVLDSDLEKCAQAHCDKHVVKMCTEYSQLLSTAVRLQGIDVGYKITHINHPCSIWVRQSVWHFTWLRNLLGHLHEEYIFRFGGKKTKHEGAVVGLNLPVPLLPDNGFTPPPQAMPDKYRHDDVVIAYRQYYIGEKMSIATYKKRPPPFFMKEGITKEELAA
jgi:hypothetical protein